MSLIYKFIERDIMESEKSIIPDEEEPGIIVLKINKIETSSNSGQRILLDLSKFEIERQFHYKETKKEKIEFLQNLELQYEHYIPNRQKLDFVKALKRIYLDNINTDTEQTAIDKPIENAKTLPAGEETPAAPKSIEINTDEIKEIDLAIAIWILCKDAINRLHPDTFVNRIKDSGLITLTGTKKKKEADRIFSLRKYQNLKTYLAKMKNGHKPIDEKIQELIEKLKPILVDYMNKKS